MKKFSRKTAIKKAKDYAKDGMSDSDISTNLFNQGYYSRLTKGKLSTKCIRNMVNGNYDNEKDRRKKNKVIKKENTLLQTLVSSLSSDEKIKLIKELSK